MGVVNDDLGWCGWLGCEAAVLVPVCGSRSGGRARSHKWTLHDDGVGWLISQRLPMAFLDPISHITVHTYVDICGHGRTCGYVRSIEQGLARRVGDGRVVHAGHATEVDFTDEWL